MRIVPKKKKNESLAESKSSKKSLEALAKRKKFGNKKFECFYMSYFLMLAEKNGR